MTRHFFRNSIVLFFLCFLSSYAAQTPTLGTVSDSHIHTHDIAGAHQHAVSKSLVVARAQGAHTTGQLFSKCTKKSCKNIPLTTGVWLQPVGLTVHQNPGSSTPGFKSRMGALLIGMDSKIRNDIILGAALGYGRSTMNFDANAGKSHVYDKFLALFGTWFTDTWYMEGSFLGGLQNYRVARNTGTGNIFALNHHSGYQLDPHIGVGYIFSSNPYQLRPFATVDYVYSCQYGHQETGAGAADLYISKSNASMLRSEAGITLSRKFIQALSYSKISLQLAAVNKRPLKRGLIIASNGSSFQSSKRITTAFSPGLEAAIFYDDGYSLSAFWIGEYASQYREQEVFIKFRKRI